MIIIKKTAFKLKRSIQLSLSMMIDKLSVCFMKCNKYLNVLEKYNVLYSFQPGCSFQTVYKNKPQVVV